MSDADFDEFENHFYGNGASYEELIAEKKLPTEPSDNNLEYLHLFVGEVDPDGTHWTGTAFQPDYHVID